MPRSTVLVVEDEEDIAELISYNLESEGYRVLRQESGEAGLQAAREFSSDLILLDLMLPGMAGLDVFRRLRAGADTASIPVIMVTAKGEEADIVAGLELGADDYVTKPFNIKVLLARVRAVLRRHEATEAPDGEVLRRGGMEIHVGRRRVLVDGAEVGLTNTEFLILRFMAGRSGWVFTRGQIVEAVRGDNYAVTERAVDVHVFSIRKKLGTHGRRIETVRGVGYRFTE